MPAYYKYFFFLVTSCGSDHLESICYYGHYAPLLFFFQYIKLCSLYFLLSIFILAVVNDINSAKIKNLESCYSCLFSRLRYDNIPYRFSSCSSKGEPHVHVP